jgi:hypothetical protein
MLAFLRALGRLYYLAFGSKRLTRLENMTLAAWRGTLSDDARQVLDAQIKAALFLQRQANGAKVCFNYELGDEIPRFHDRGPNLLVGTVVLDDMNSRGAGMKAKIFVHHGLFFSIEFPKRPDRFLSLHGMQEQSTRAFEVISHVNLR